MPTAMLPSPSRRIHSWLAVYFRSSGTFMRTPLELFASLREQRLAVARERRLHDARRQFPVANDDAHRITLRDASGDSRQSDRAAERRSERAARDLAVARRRAHDLVRAQHAALVEQQQADLPPRGRVRL